MARGSCSVADCSGSHLARGLCQLHYDRLRTRGTSAPPFSKLPPDVRFWAHVIRHDGACWEWTGSTTAKGYGSIWVPGRRAVVASRFSWELHNGPIPEDLIVCHHCDNPPCVNPEHLFLGTKRDNNNDKMAKQRQARGERIGTSRFTAEQVRQIRYRADAGEPLTHIARDLECRLYAIQQIVARQTWRHVA